MTMLVHDNPWLSQQPLRSFTSSTVTFTFTLQKSYQIYKYLLENVKGTGRKYTAIFVQKLYIMRNEVIGQVSTKM